MINYLSACNIVAAQIEFITVPTVKRFNSKTIHHKRLRTLAIHSFVTIDGRDAIKWNLRNVQKWPVFAQPVTYHSYAAEGC